MVRKCSQRYFLLLVLDWFLLVYFFPLQGDSDDSDSASTSTTNPNSSNNSNANSNTSASTATTAAPKRAKSNSASFNNDGADGVGRLSAEEVRRRAFQLLELDESGTRVGSGLARFGSLTKPFLVDELYDCIAPALDRELFVTVAGYSVASVCATRLALRLKNSNFRIRRVMTFGAPR